MRVEIIEKAYQWMLEGSRLLQQVHKESFFDGYIKNIENIIQDHWLPLDNESLDEETKERLKTLYHNLKNLSLSAEEWRKVSQLVLLKGTLDEPIQANHQLTPDSIGFLLAYFIEQLTKDKSKLVLLDETVGTGNLLLTLLTNLSLAKKKVEGCGIDIDDTLLRIADVNSQLVKVDLQLFHQDALRGIPIVDLDIVVSDLPVGYYPNDAWAKNFEVATDNDEHTYAHHLLIEQGISVLREGGFALFLLPTNLLETEQVSLLKKWLQNQAYLQGVIQLPENLFQKKQVCKSIYIFQKSGENVRQKELLVTSLNSLSDAEEMKQFFSQFQKWSAEYS
ncbi:MAG: class I SAM-dependent methyltransferase [Lactobacillales bacterium]|jgi:site-specific DNA-methyltransferase (adenine-specific)|nr:class I SAM-dependent methyltransferase [Lactobacillales bacterium]